MALLLHAITTPPERPVAMDGLRQYQLCCRTFERVTTWCTSLPEDVTPFTRADLLAHHRIVVGIFDRVAGCLPARFPTVIADEEQIRERVPRLQAGLERVRDACELAVTATWLDSSRPETGREYLLRRMHAAELAEDIESEVGSDLMASDRTICPSRKLALSLAILVKRKSAEHVKARVPRARAGVRILVNGPWPPYTFAALNHFDPRAGY